MVSRCGGFCELVGFASRPQGKPSGGPVLRPHGGVLDAAAVGDEDEVVFGEVDDRGRAGFGFAEPPCGRRPCFCWNYSRSSIYSGKPAEGVRAKNAENRAAIPLPGMLLAWDNPAPLIYH